MTLTERANEYFKAKRAGKLAEAEAAERELLSHPELAENEKKRQTLTIRIARAKAAGEVPSALEKERAGLEKERVRLAKKIGFDLSRLVPRFDCPLCEDTGYVDHRPCVCFRRFLNEQALSLLGLRRPELPSFSEFDFDLFEDPARKRAEAGRYLQFCANYPRNVRNALTFYGPPGTGKSFLAGCLCSEFQRLDRFALFLPAGELNRLFFALIREDGRQFDELLQSADLLVLDDLGTEPLIPNITKEHLLDLISRRTNSDKLTVVTTNLSPEDFLKRYGERLFSRLLKSRRASVIPFRGRDLR